VTFYVCNIEAIEVITILASFNYVLPISQISDLKRQLSRGGSQIASSRSPQPIEEPVEDQTRRLVFCGRVGTSPLVYVFMWCVFIRNSNLVS